MDEVEQRKELFAWYGSTAYQAQCFEVELRILLILVARIQSRAVSPAELDELWSSLESSTLGGLLSELKRHSEFLHPDFEALLREYVRKRNYLVHHFFYANAASLMTAAGRSHVLNELRELHTALAEAHEIALGMSTKVREWLGWSEEDFQKHVETQLENLLATS